MKRIKNTQGLLTYSYDVDPEIYENFNMNKHWEPAVSYISNAQDEFSSSVQRIFLLATFHTKDVDFAKMASCGDVFRVWREGDCPCIDWRREQKKKKKKKDD